METSISLSSGTALNNSATSGYGIYSNTNNDTNLTITNAGTISTSDHADSIAVNVIDSDGGSATTINNTGTISAGSSGAAINVGRSDSSASITNSESGSIVGKIMVGANNALIINNSSGGISGEISASTGDIDITNTSGTITGNINLGSNGSSSIALNEGSISGNVAMGNSTQVVSLNGGTITGTIDGAGLLNLTASSYTLGGNVGSSNSITKLSINGNSFNSSDYAITASNVEIGSGGLLTAGSRSITGAVTLETSSSTLKLGAGSVTGNIQGATDGVGKVEFLDTNTLAGNVGTALNSLSSITLAGSKTLNAGSNSLDATTITLKESSILNTTSGNITGAVVLESGSSLTTAGIITGAVALGTNSTLTTTRIITGDVTLESNSTLSLGSGSEVVGVINGSSSGNGSVNTSGNVLFESNIGSTNSIALLEILSGSSTTFNGNISANNITIAGTANLGDVSKVITGNLAGSGAGVINLANGSHAVSGNFTANSGDTISLNVFNASSSGSISAAGAAMLSSSTNLNVSLSSTDIGGSVYTIVSGGSGSAIDAISDANINIDDSGTNRAGALVFTTYTSGNNLVLRVGTENTKSSSNSGEDSVYNAINSFTNTTGTLYTKT